jgi:hypothetical protein
MMAAFTLRLEWWKTTRNGEALVRVRRPNATTSRWRLSTFLARFDKPLLVAPCGTARAMPPVSSAQRR